MQRNISQSSVMYEQHKKASAKYNTKKGITNYHKHPELDQIVKDLA